MIVENETCVDFSKLSADRTKRLNQIADEIMCRYTSFVDECCKRYGDCYLFWATPFASRNLYNDGLFLSLCRISLAIELIKTDNISCINTVYSSEKEVLDMIVGNEIMVTTSESTDWIDEGRRFINRVVSLARLCWTELSYKIHCRNYMPSCKEDMSIVITPTISSCFDGLYYNDRYFTSILEYHNALFIPHINNNTNIGTFELINKHIKCLNYRFLVRQKYLRLTDFLEIVKYWRVSDRMKRDLFVFDDIDITPIVQRSIEDGKVNSTSYVGILARRALQRISKDTKIRVKNFIIWYEGRPSEAMISTAIREFFPKSRCIGFQGFPMIESDPSSGVSDYQFRSGHSPSEMAIPGRMYKPVAKRFCKDIPLLYTPILRNEYIIKKKNNDQNKKKKILVLMSYTFEASCEMLEGVRKFIGDSDYGYIIQIKNHPVYHKFSLNDYGYSESLEVEYVDGDLNGCLKNVDVVVASLTSSTLEVVCAGIPLVLLYPSGQIGYSCLPNEIRSGLCHVVYNAEEITKEIEISLKEKYPDNQILDGLLTPKTKENILNMFN